MRISYFLCIPPLGLDVAIRSCCNPPKSSKRDGVLNLYAHCGYGKTLRASVFKILSTDDSDEEGQGTNKLVLLCYRSELL